MEILVLAVGGFAAVLVAYANGANDNFKGVATLAGSGTTDYRRALWWATATTFAGSIIAIVLAGQLYQMFSGKRLVSAALAAQGEYQAAVALGAALTILLATWLGMPISTTHALMGCADRGRLGGRLNRGLWATDAFFHAADALKPGNRAAVHCLLASLVSSRAVEIRRRRRNLPLRRSRSGRGRAGCRRQFRSSCGCTATGGLNDHPTRRYGELPTAIFRQSARAERTGGA